MAITLSFALMVKDEQELLPQCLTSIKTYADEIIVVDTGSTDDTVKIAKSFGAQVYHHPWEDDYSKHRNQSISYVTSDWMCLLDADEKFIVDPRANWQDILTWIENLPDNISAIQIVVHDIQANSQIMECNSMRFFRKGTISYHNIVHNTPSITGGAVFLHDVVIHHFGYDLSPEKMRKKFKRSVRLLNKRLKDDPHDYQAYFYLSQQYGNHDLNKVIEYGLKYIELKNNTDDDFIHTVWMSVAQTLMKQKKLDQAYDIINKGLSVNNQNADLLLCKTEYHIKSKQFLEAIQTIYDFFDVYEYLKLNKTKMGGTFWFSLREDIVMIQLYRLIIIHFQMGIKSLENFKRHKQAAPQQVIKDLIKNFTDSGLSNLISDL